MSKVIKGSKNGMYGKKHTAFTKKQIAEKLKERGGYSGKKNPNYGNKWTKRMKEKAGERIKLSGCFAGKRNPNFGNFKVPQDDHLKIIKLIRAKQETYFSLSEKYSVHPETIRNIFKRGIS